ncbi:DNA repair protein rad51c, partial [Clonorchis sinensis]
LNVRYLRIPSEEDCSSTHDIQQNATSVETPASTGFSFIAELIIDYVAHLFESREYLEALIRHRAKFSDFLSRCSTTSSNQRLDLWHFLSTGRVLQLNELVDRQLRNSVQMKLVDWAARKIRGQACTRTRFTRYSLLFDRLLELVVLPPDDAERFSVYTARHEAKRITAEIDQRAGEAQCLFQLKRIQVDQSFEYKDVIFRQNKLLLSGDLRVRRTLVHTVKRGLRKWRISWPITSERTRVKAFLFPEVLLLALPLSKVSRRDRLKSLFSAFVSASPPPDKSIRLRPGAPVCRARPRWLWWLPTDGSKRNDASQPLCISSSLFEFSCTDDQLSLVPHYIKRYRLFGDAIILKDFVLEDVANNYEKQKPFTLKRIALNWLLVPSVFSRSILGRMLADSKFRELVSLPLSTSVLQRLTQSGYYTVGEVSGATPEKLASTCGIDLDAARDALHVVHRYQDLADFEESGISSFLRDVPTAYELLNAFASPQSTTVIPDFIVSMCRSFDEMLGGGFPTGRLTELCGEPGVGKTQFCIQTCLTVQLPRWFGGLEGEAVFIDSEGNFVPRRAKQMAESLVTHCRRHVELDVDDEPATEELRNHYCPNVDSLLSGIHYIRVTDHLQLLATCKRLQQFCEQHPKVRLVVVDSIALPFRYDFDDIPQRNRLLACVAQQLLSVATNYKAVVILTNQITTRIETRVKSDENPPGSDYTSSTGRLVPALGESWGHICAVRIFLTRSSDICRQCKLLKHPGRPFGSGVYQITSGGIRDYVQ